MVVMVDCVLKVANFLDGHWM